MFEAVVAGATDPEIEGVEVVRRPALTVSPVEMLEADGYLLGTPANLGYVSGALKHAFDQSYYQLLDTSRGRPFGVYIHGNEGTEGAERGIAAITTGLGWMKAANWRSRALATLARQASAIDRDAGSGKISSSPLCSPSKMPCAALSGEALGMSRPRLISVSMGPRMAAWTATP